MLQRAGFAIVYMTASGCVVAVLGRGVANVSGDALLALGVAGAVWMVLLQLMDVGRNPAEVRVHTASKPEGERTP